MCLTLSLVLYVCLFAQALGSIDLSSIWQLVSMTRDTDMQEALTSAAKAYALGKKDSVYAAVNIANLAVRALEQYSFHRSNNTMGAPVDYENEADLKMAAGTTARSLFEQAIAQSDHYGAHYSLGLLLKLYPTYSPPDTSMRDRALGGGNRDGQCLNGSVTSGYDQLCMSVSSFAGQLARVYQRQCKGVEVVHSWHHGRGIPSRVQVKPLDVLPGSYAVDHRNFSTYMVHLLQTTYISGPDYAMHDLFVDSPSPRPCHIYLTSSGCYLPLFRQFPRTAQPPPILSLPRAASILQYSGAAYYHWVFESLPHLLLLRRELTALQRADDDAAGAWAADVALLLPSSRQTFVLETLSLLFRDPTHPAPFARVAMVQPTDILAVGELLYVDWEAPQAPPAESEQETSTQLWPPPEALELVRSTFVPRFPPPEGRNLLIFVTRKASQSRSIVNERDVLNALQDATSLVAAVFEGSEAGIMGALRLFPYARIVLGVHGGGLTNVVFTAPGTIVMEITLPETEFQEYRHASGALSLEYRPVDGQIPPASFESRVLINTDQLARALDEVIKEGHL